MTNTEKVFLKSTDQAFSYLVNEYGFVSRNANDYEKSIWGNYSKTFFSQKLEVQIVVERSEVVLSVKTLVTPPGFKDYMSKQFYFMEILDYFAPNHSYLGDIFIIEDDKTVEDCPDFLIDKINEIAQLFKQYCTLMIKGDLNCWSELDALRKKNIKEFKKDI